MENLKIINKTVGNFLDPFQYAFRVKRGIDGQPHILCEKLMKMNVYRSLTLGTSNRLSHLKATVC